MLVKNLLTNLAMECVMIIPRQSYWLTINEDYELLLLNLFSTFNVVPI